MPSDSDLKELVRELKEQNRNLKRIGDLGEAINKNLVVLGEHLTKKEE